MMSNLGVRRAGGFVAGVALAILAAGCAAQQSVPTPVAPGMQSAGRAGAGAPVAPNFSSIEYTAGIPSGATPHGMAHGPGGMWFTETAINEIARISTSGAVKQFPLLATSSGPNQIVEGADHNMWFTETGADVIGRVTNKGVVTEFPVGNEAYGPWDVTLGSDGNVWFTLRSPSTNAIGKITPAGVVTLFTSGLSPGDVAVHDVTTGYDGNVWFCEEFGNRIGRITPQGAIAEFAMGITSNAGLVDITKGPNDAMWFTENSANKIGRISLNGVVQEFSTGITPNSGPGSIMNAKNYAWFTEANSSPTRLGRISGNGTVTEFSLPGGFDGDIAVGAPSNDLWITDYSGNGIIQVSE